ncbi:hypothetical protein [Lichenicoccus sp.]|uniref:hypothetical protein n=1 Tax=Lichenicoccus sp. TaxID=2781899 RepID=UPI003D09C221
MTRYLYFNFFGDDGPGSSYGEVCVILATISVFILFPGVTIFCLYSMPEVPGTDARRTES